MKLLLFDIDGTLLLTNGAGTRAANRAFENIYGISEAMTKIDAAGKTDPIILKEIFKNELNRDYSHEEAKELYKLYIPFLEEETSASETTVMPGIPRLLENLSRREDIVLGVATGNIEQGAWIKLKSAGLDHHFKFGGFGSDSHLREHLIIKAKERAIDHVDNGTDIQKTFVIGDTPYDINHGRAAGAVTVGVATGSYSRAELEEHSPDHLFDDLNNLEIVLGIFE
ncbi:MAG: HAD family hydrolase [Thermodesulfobacteriales bacterium]|nr:MAG: HAD family hydrolase [Thermodesulfobacteriales bacterium]